MPDPNQPSRPQPMPIGSLLDQLGCEISLFDGDMPYGAIVLLAVTGVDGSVLRTADAGCDWLTLRGLLTAASDLATEGWPNHAD